LAISGLIFQTILKNPLAEPFTLGISSGASFGAALGIFISNYILHFKLPIFPFAMVGGMITILILFYFTTRKNVSLFAIIFVGISISYFFNALLTFLMSLLGDKSYEVLLWMFGTLTNPPDVEILFLFFVLFMIGFGLIFLFNKKLDILYMSDEVVKSLGVNINTTRIILLIITSVLTIISVSYCGIIGFVGLIVPHIARLLFGNNHKFLIPSSALIGGILLLISDDIARSIVGMFNDYGKELPIGVVTSLLGTPFFLYFLIKSRRFL
ncbi:MAG TPA: iron ABC transporter permease, partial [Spirochaetota bacterium]|nr:iron ABC transporter permease [Spirochaetota bacterium]